MTWNKIVLGSITTLFTLIICSSCFKGVYTPNRDVMKSAEWDCYIQMKKELDDGMDINRADYYSDHNWIPNRECCMLTFAVTKQYPEVVKYLLSRGADINQIDSLEGTPLICACGRANLQIINILLDHHANATLNAKENDLTPLQVLVCNTGGMSDQQAEIAQVIDRLIEAGCDINHKARSEHTALDFAERYNPDLKEILVKRGAKSSLF